MSWMVNFEFLLHYCSKILGGVDSRVTVNQRFLSQVEFHRRDSEYVFEKKIEFLLNENYNTKQVHRGCS